MQEFGACSGVLTLQHPSFRWISAPSHTPMASPIHPALFKSGIPLVTTLPRVHLSHCWDRKRAVPRLQEWSLNLGTSLSTEAASALPCPSSTAQEALGGTWHFHFPGLSEVLQQRSAYYPCRYLSWFQLSQFCQSNYSTLTCFLLCFFVFGFFSVSKTWVASPDCSTVWRAPLLKAPRLALSTSLPVAQGGLSTSSRLCSVSNALSLHPLVQESLTCLKWHSWLRSPLLQAHLVCLRILFSP